MSQVVRSQSGLTGTVRNASETITSEEIRNSLTMLQEWVERQGYRGYEPFDGLSSWARPLACGNLFAERLLQQLVVVAA